MLKIMIIFMPDVFYFSSKAGLNIAKKAVDPDQLSSLTLI